MQSLELWSVIEMEPGRYGQAEIPPQGCEPGLWLQYWRQCLACKGLGHLQPVGNSWIVPVEQFRTEVELKPLLEAQLEVHGPEPDWTRPGPFSGGFVLVRDGQPDLRPGCCGDLGNLADWTEACVHRDPEWKQVWIGHPWVSVRYFDGGLQISQPHQSESPVPRGQPLDPEDLASAVEGARKQLLDLRLRLRPILEKLAPSALIEPAIDAMIPVR